MRIQRKIEKTEGQLFCTRSVDFEKLKASETPMDNGIRIYGGVNCAVLQLRGEDSITPNGKPIRIIATASYLDRKEVRALIEQLQEIEKTLV